jgi:hypothetical protein
MSLAPRVQVYQDLACQIMRPMYYNSTLPDTSRPGLDGLSPLPLILSFPVQFNSSDQLPVPSPEWRKLRCIQDPQVQAEAAKLQTRMCLLA